MDNYTKVNAYISDIRECESDSTIGVRNNSPRYMYTIHWFYNNEEYVEIVETSDKPNINLNCVWINEDNTDIVLSSPESKRLWAYTCLVYSVLNIIILIIVFRNKQLNCKYND